MALKVKKRLLLCWAIILASVVLPVPGGPQNISEGKKPLSICCRKAPYAPTKCSCPTYCASVVGRIRSANGINIFIVSLYKLTKKTAF